jgi:hypothetical protein
MTVLARWTDFRFVFAKVVELTPGNIAFTAPDLIVAGGGGGDEWAPAGFEVGMTVRVSGPGVDGTTNAEAKTIESFPAAPSIRTVEKDITTLGAGGSRVADGRFIDPDGIEGWPVANVRAGGFDAGFTGFTVPYDGNPMTITINAGAADASPGVDEYDWYLSQRTDEASNQYFTIVQAPDSGGQSFSGSVVLDITTLAQTEFGITPGTILTSAQLVNLFRKMSLYVQRRSDDAIQWVDLLRVQVANV